MAFNISFGKEGICQKEVTEKCIPLNGTTCFGAQLDYMYTSVELVDDSDTLQKANEKLLLWSGLKSVPLCWEVIQPLLCSLYLPKCENGTIHLPDRTLCQNTRSPCKIVETENGWPSFMLCDNDKVFADNCPETINTNQFNKSDCERPLMATSNPSSWYEGVEGCGLQCMNPLFNQAEHDDMHLFIAVCSSITTVCTLFAMLSFFIDWKNSSKYPARIIFYINVCFFLCSFGWLAQFFQGGRNEIVCRRDGTARLGEPVGQGESPSCVIIFVLVYFFVMAGTAWFVVLSYSWMLMFKALGSELQPLKGKTLYFHLFVWSVSFILLIASLALSQIDGNSMSGICFIGYNNHWYRMGFLLVPIGLMLFAGGFFLFGGLHALVTIKHSHDGLLSENAVSKITWTMIRIGVFAFFAFFFVIIAFGADAYEIVNQPLWDRSFRDYIRCEANVTILEKLNEDIVDPAAGGCHISNRPNVSVMKLHLFAMFGTGIVMSAWVWTRASFMNWRRAWFKLIGRSDNEMKRIRRRSKLIAKAFANRHALGIGRRKTVGDTNEEDNNDGGINPEDLEFSEHTMTHQDPVGMDFDLNSVSQELSSEWVRQVPQMVRRRGAIMPQPMPSSSPAPSSHRDADDEGVNITWARARNKSLNSTPSNRSVNNELPPLRTSRITRATFNNNENSPWHVPTHETRVFQPQINESFPGFVEEEQFQAGDMYDEHIYPCISVGSSQLPSGMPNSNADVLGVRSKIVTPLTRPPLRSSASKPSTATKEAW